VQEEATRAARESVQLTTNQYRAGTVSLLNLVIVQAAQLNAERAMMQLLGPPPHRAGRLDSIPRGRCLTPGLSSWIGRSETREDTITAAPLVALSALLDRDDPQPRAGDAAPPLAHWLYFLPNYRQSEAGPDGHAMKGGFLPPLTELPRACGPAAAWNSCARSKWAAT
jgi:hypothetical protein